MKMHVVAEPERVCQELQAQAADESALSRLGITVLEVGHDGSVTLCLVTGASMLNGLSLLHGGYAFLLADTAFAYACKAIGRDSVTHHSDFTFMSATGTGVTLFAHAKVVHVYGSNTMVEVQVSLADGTAVAVGRFHGRVVR